MADDDARAPRTTRTTAGAKKATAKKAAAPAKKVPVRKAASVAKAPRARKAAVKKAAPARDRGATLAPRPKKAPAMRLAAEQTFDDDWEAPEPAPVREDPQARIRALLRNAALEVEARSAARPAAPAPARPAPAPPEPDEPVTRVLVAPAPPEEEWLAEDAELDEEEITDDGGEWAAPDVLEEVPEDEVRLRTVASAPPPSQSPRPPSDAPPPAPPAPPSTTEFTPPPFEAPATKPAPAPGAKRERSGLRTAIKAVAALLLVTALVAGAVWAQDRFGDEGIDYSALKVGDCFDSSASNEIRGIELKSCAEPHNSEIFFLVNHPAGPDDAYPGKDTLVQFAADACLGQPLTQYLGIPLEQSKLKDFEIVPQESAWEDGKRVLVCGLDTGGEGDITGSVMGTRR